MQLRVQMMGALKSKAPTGGVVEVPAGSTIDDVLSQLGVNPPEVQIVMVNGSPEANRRRSLASGDELTVLAPVGGG